MVLDLVRVSPAVEVGGGVQRPACSRWALGLLRDFTAQLVDADPA